ncbi:uncharacterized protein LOC110979129 [Acanthaster planci]|uniref:Uncharacterized protein LOC110979129 n=1 Tax=Acanthaster planci TaxID=133434 RepID=A0A8B7YAX2_ACAPL|nr:uncharacterized protein LOC110979129 [Acanthaster planci]
MAELRRYRQTLELDRNRLIDAFEDVDADYPQVAETLVIKHSTARSVFAVYLRDGRRNKLPKGGPQNEKIDEGTKDALLRYVDDNPLLTVRQLNDHLRTNLPDKPVRGHHAVPSPELQRKWHTQLSRRE